MSEPQRIRRFYEKVSVGRHEGGGWVILLDGRTVKTPGGALMRVPVEPLAQEIAEEWRRQADHIDRASMPLSGMLSGAIDGGAEGAAAALDDIVKYLGSDLVCYRAVEPAALADRQSAAWDPYIDIMRGVFGAILVTTAGVVAVAQPETTIARVRRDLRNESPETLFALRIATALSGSAAIALAVWKGASEAEAAFEASRVDERFQEQRWGVDAEARAREEGLRRDFLTAARFLALLQA